MPTDRVPATGTLPEAASQEEPMSTLPVSPPQPRRFRTTDPELAHAMISRTYARHAPRLSGDRGRFRFEVAALDTDRFSIETFSHSMSCEARVESHNELVALEVGAGRLELATGGRSLILERGEVALLDLRGDHLVRWDGLASTFLRLAPAMLERFAAETAGIRPDRVGFTLSRPLSAARQRHWQAVLRHVRQDVLGVEEIAGSALLRSEALQLLMTALVTTFPNGALDALTDPAAPGPGRTEPATLRRAVSYVDTHAREPIGVTDIAAAARVSVRGLQQAFRRYRDTTPLEYLRLTRMHGAHRELADADPTRGDTVAAIAGRWGFAHHGRFAAQYRHVFGCDPSHTLRS